MFDFTAGRNKNDMSNWPEHFRGQLSVDAVKSIGVSAIVNNYNMLLVY